MDVSVREAVPGDAGRIRDVHLASIEELAQQSYSEKQVAAWAHERDLEEYPIEAEDTYFVVANDEAEVIGFGWMNLDAGDYFQSEVEGEITAIYVHPSAARNGIGSQLYSELEAEAVRNNISALGLWASLNAVSFYQAQGFQRVADHVHEYREGIDLTLVEMVKKSIH
jgi:putative acetyltransferase